MKFFELLDFAWAGFPPHFGKKNAQHELAAHTNIAVNSGIRYVNAFFSKGVPPGNYMVICAIHECAVQIEEDGGGYLLLRFKTVLICG